jgi:adenylate cyclase
VTVLSNTLESDISTILGTTWDKRSGQVVPKTEDVALANGAVSLDAVVLYADLANSTKLARTFPYSMAAKIVRAYLSTMTRLIKDHGGAVRSFDGDRVMGVFVGDSKNSSAAKCGLKMKYVVAKMLRPKAEAKFPSLVSKGFVIKHCVGIARSELLVVRGGVRGSNDLVFIGSAPNIAAKLSEVRNSPWHTYITHNVYKYLNKDATYGSDGRNMWTATKRTLGDETWDLYKSSWWWSP